MIDEAGRQTLARNVPGRSSRKRHWLRWILAGLGVIVVLAVLAVGAFIKLQPTLSPLVLPTAGGGGGGGAPRRRGGGAGGAARRGGRPAPWRARGTSRPARWRVSASRRPPWESATRPSAGRTPSPAPSPSPARTSPRRRSASA